tara:strand:- start:41 stop:223 length:183 start_codon:yes stop_codon:yes gene_type:complete
MYSNNICANAPVKNNIKNIPKFQINFVDFPLEYTDINVNNVPKNITTTPTTDASTNNNCK